MRSFTIATVEPGDLADVAALFRAYAATLDVDLSLQGFERELAELPGAYAPPNGALLLARNANATALGCVALRAIGDGVCEMKRLYVRPDARGMGLGSALVGASIENAAALGYREMKLDTLAQLEDAIALYRRFGFTPIEPYGDHPYAGTLCFGKVL
jgi:GNAT superfamily N-acetyltransferase